MEDLKEKALPSQKFKKKIVDTLSQVFSSSKLLDKLKLTVFIKICEEKNSFK